MYIQIKKSFMYIESLKLHKIHIYSKYKIYSLKLAKSGLNYFYFWVRHGIFLSKNPTLIYSKDRVLPKGTEFIINILQILEIIN